MSEFSRIIVCGDRHYWGGGTMWAVLLDLKEQGLRLVIQGEATGADLLAREVALDLGISVIGIPANWKGYGRAAGPIRNQQMLQTGDPQAVVAFHDNLAESKGTKNMLSQGLKAGLKCFLVVRTEDGYYLKRLESV